jgi:hypothetical protein
MKVSIHLNDDDIKLAIALYLMSKDVGTVKMNDVVLQITPADNDPRNPTRATVSAIVTRDK